MIKLNLGKDLYLKGRIGWRGLSKDEYVEQSEYRIINATSLMDGFVDWDNCGYITKERYEESEEIMLNERDILISKDGTLGKIGYVKNLTLPTTVASGVFVLRNTIEEKLDFDFLYHLLKSHIFKDFIKRNKAIGSTINHLYQRDLENFELELPDVIEQRRISKILNVIDAKISSNIKINSALEEMARTIYEYWFLQFDFPNENGKPYKSSGGKMVWNEELNREIPKGWKVCALSDIESNIITGKTPSTKNKSNFGGNIPFITIADIRPNAYINKVEKTLTKSGADTQSSKYLPEDALCVSCIATIGEIGFTTQVSQTNQQINSIIFENDENKFFLYFYLKWYFQAAFAAKTGNTFSNMNKGDFSTIRVLKPKECIVKEYHQQIKEKFNMMKLNTLESVELEKLRDFLLPMLMNGQVTFKN